jgi:hypothetical protein
MTKQLSLPGIAVEDGVASLAYDLAIHGASPCAE